MTIILTAIDMAKEKENSNRISLPYKNRSKINERVIVFFLLSLIFHSSSFERHKEQMRDLSQWNNRCSVVLDNLLFRRMRMYLSRFDLYWTTPCSVFQSSSIDIEPAELNKLLTVFFFSQGSHSIIFNNKTLVCRMRIGKEKKKREWEINFSSHAYVQQTEIDIDDNIQGKTVREKEKSEKCW